MAKPIFSHPLVTSDRKITGGGGGGAPTGATYLVLNLDATLTAERVLTAGTNISFVDTGPNGTLTISATGGTGTVTSVGLSLPVEFTVTGSPVVGAGTLTGSWTNESANKVFAGPPSGAATVPTFRALVPSDLPPGAIIPGPPGDDGDDGWIGPPGAAGAAGTAGLRGPPGQDGTDGDDSYGLLGVPTRPPVNLTGGADVTGVLPIANGGTARTTNRAAFDFLAPSFTKGDLIVFQTGPSTNEHLPVGTNGQVLTADSTDPTFGVVWKTPAAAGMGPPGMDGSDGEDGWIGPPGPAGATGPQGPAGSGSGGGVAMPGVDGEDGVDGFVGHAFQGVDGVTITNPRVALNVGGLTQQSPPTSVSSFVPYFHTGDATHFKASFDDIAATLNGASTLDHRSLNHLTPQDDHTQYLFLAGRAGGQSGIGGTAASENLTLQSTTNATKGLLRWDDPQLWWPSFSNYTAGVSETRRVARWNPTFSSAPIAGITHQCWPIVLDPPITSTSAGGFNAALSFRGLSITPSGSFGSNCEIIGVFGGGTYTSTSGAPGLGAFALFSAQPTLTSATAGASAYAPLIFNSQPTVTYNATGTATLGFIREFQGNTTVDNLSSGTHIVTDWDQVFLSPVVKQTAGTTTITTLRGIRLTAPTITGTPAVTTHVGVDIENLNIATTVNEIGVRSAITTASTARFLKDTGGAMSEFKGMAIFSYTPTSQTVPTGFYTQFAKRQTWTGTQRVTLQGTARMRGN